VVADLDSSSADGRLTLVAHSSGGLVVPGVAAALGGRVSAVVLNAALVPTEGGCGVDCMKERHREGLQLAREAAEREGTSITLPGPPEDPESFRNAYGGDPLVTIRWRSSSIPSGASRTPCTTTSSRSTGLPSPEHRSSMY